MKKIDSEKPPLSGGKANATGIVGLGDLLRQSLAKRGGPPPKPTRSPRPGGVRNVVHFRQRRRD